MPNWSSIEEISVYYDKSIGFAYIKMFNLGINSIVSEFISWMNKNKASCEDVLADFLSVSGFDVSADLDITWSVINNILDKVDAIPIVLVSDILDKLVQARNESAEIYKHIEQLREAKDEEIANFNG